MSFERGQRMKMVVHDIGRMGVFQDITSDLMDIVAYQLTFDIEGVQGLWALSLCNKMFRASAIAAAQRVCQEQKEDGQVSFGPSGTREFVRAQGEAVDAAAAVLRAVADGQEVRETDFPDETRVRGFSTSRPLMPGMRFSVVEGALRVCDFYSLVRTGHVGMVRMFSGSNLIQLHVLSQATVGGAALVMQFDTTSLLQGIACALGSTKHHSVYLQTTSIASVRWDYLLNTQIYNERSIAILKDAPPYSCRILAEVVSRGKTVRFHTPHDCDEASPANAYFQELVEFRKMNWPRHRKQGKPEFKLFDPSPSPWVEFSIELFQTVGIVSDWSMAAMRR
jgi:hypothetical protein